VSPLHAHGMVSGDYACRAILLEPLLPAAPKCVKQQGEWRRSVFGYSGGLVESGARLSPVAGHSNLPKREPQVAESLVARRLSRCD
jgi:hypothetical protein